MDSSRRSDFRQCCFSPYLYRARNRVERFFNRIKQMSSGGDALDKLAANCLLRPACVNQVMVAR
jgi:transposase